MIAAPKEGPAWSLESDPFNRCMRLVLLLANGHTVKFDLPADSPMVLGILAAQRLVGLEPA